MRRGAPTVLLMIAALAAAGGLAACSDDETTTTTRTQTVVEGEITLDGVSTTLAVDALTTGVLRDNGIEVLPLPPARSRRAGVTFPVTGGSLGDDSTGTINHAGGLRFASGDIAVDATDFVIDTRARQLFANVGGNRTALLNLDLAGLQRVEDDDGVIVVSGITTSLTAGAASALGTALQTPVFTPALELGSATVRVTGA